MLEEKQPKIILATIKEEKRRSSGNKRSSKLFFGIFYKPVSKHILFKILI